MLSVQLRRVAMVLMRMERMTVRRMGMMRGLLVVAGLGMLSSFTMMFRGMFVVFRRPIMVFVDIVFTHRYLPGDCFQGASRIIGHDELIATVLRLRDLALCRQSLRAREQIGLH
jgi:hypothetical protein